MLNEIDIVKYIDKIDIIWDPKSPKKTYSLKELIPNIKSITKLLLLLINDEENDVTLLRLKNDFYTHLEKIIEFQSLNELPIALEGLAQKYEAFLKKIGYLMYKDTVFWEGDSVCNGITNTTLYNLSIGLLNNKNKIDKEVPLTSLPVPIIATKGTILQLNDIVRVNLRNVVHDAPDMPRKEILAYSEIAIAVYLLAIKHNEKFLSERYLPEYQYLNKITKNSDYKNLDNVYVNIFGEDFSDIEIQGNLIIDLDPEIQFKDEFNYEEPEIDYLIDIDQDDLPIVIKKSNQSILEIERLGKSFIIIGDPGAGKSTTLLKILYQNSISILNGSKKKIPIYLPAKEYSPNNNFLIMLYRSIGEDYVKESLQTGNIQILIDGTNEIQTRYKREATIELKNLIIDYPNCNFIISERKTSYKKQFDLPAYEIKALENQQIEEFISKYDKKTSVNLWNQLKNNEELMELAHNPLMLKMILYISRTGIVPSNKGLLYYYFIKNIFQ
jgi:hypothetical protein